MGWGHILESKLMSPSEVLGVRSTEVRPKAI